MLEVHSKKTLTSTNARGKGVGSILENQIDELSGGISQVVVALPEEAEGEQLRVADVTTNSMDAFRHYYEGIKHWDDVHKARAEVSLVKALEIDSTRR